MTLPFYWMCLRYELIPELPSCSPSPIMPDPGRSIVAVSGTEAVGQIMGRKSGNNFSQTSHMLSHTFKQTKFSGLEGQFFFLGATITWGGSCPSSFDRLLHLNVEGKIILELLIILEFLAIQAAGR
jgi:hypothetical protein